MLCWSVVTSNAIQRPTDLTIATGVGIGALGKHSPPLGDHPKPGTTITRTNDDVNAEKVGSIFPPLQCNRLTNEKIVRAFSIMEKITFLLIKSSVVLSYRRVFTAHVLIQRLTTALLVFLALQTIAFIVAGGMQCTIRSWARWWQDWTIENNCTSAVLVWVGFSVTDVFTDLVLLLLPIPPVIHLHMKKSKKVAAIGMLVLGSLSTAIGLARMGFLIHFTWGTFASYRHDERRMLTKIF